jgi:hypothetical protein
MTSKAIMIPKMCLDYHLVNTLGDDEQDEQQSDVLDDDAFDLLTRCRAT